MKRIFFFLPILLFAFCQPNEENHHGSRDKKTTNTNDTALKTGWYYLSDSASGVLRKMYKDTTQKRYYVNPNPILTVADFSSVELREYPRDPNHYLLAIKFDDQGKESWRVATRNSISKPLGLIIDNVLIECPIVQSEIVAGISALNRGDLTKDELLNFQKAIQAEMKK